MFNNIRPMKTKVHLYKFIDYCKENGGLDTPLILVLDFDKEEAKPSYVGRLKDYDGYNYEGYLDYLTDINAYVFVAPFSEVKDE